jgi:iron complex transport system permease protein
MAALVLASATLFLGLASLFVGYAHLSPNQVIDGLRGGEEINAIIVMEIRLPRALLAIAIGAALGMGGAALQGLMRNPLAEPGVIGISAAASLGAVGAMYYGLSALWPWALPGSAMAGASVATLILLWVSRHGGLLSLILAGVAISSLCAALTSVALNLSPNAYAASEIVYWLLGSLKDRSMADVSLALPFIAIALAMLAWNASALDALSLGEEVAESMGVNVRRLAAWMVLAISIGVGASVAVAGAIGFVGLIVPHVLRPLVGERPSALIWPSAFGGASLLLAADMGVRLIPTASELMVGVMTALLGAPFFFWLIITRSKQWA